jgi:hypothetical protein
MDQALITATGRLQRQAGFSISDAFFKPAYNGSLGGTVAHPVPISALVA